MQVILRVSRWVISISIVLLTLSPQDEGQWFGGFVNVVPFSSLDLSPLGLRNAAGNVAMFVPLGFVLGLLGLVFRSGRDTVLRVLAICFTVSLSIETLQFVFPSGRVPDVDDVILNTAGSFIGAIASLVASRLAALRPAVRVSDSSVQ